MTDKELVEGIVEKNRRAIQFLISTYQKQVIKTAYYFVQNMEDAEDLSQEIFLDVIKEANHFRGNARISTWLYRITVNKSLNFIRKKKRMGFIHQLETIFHLHSEVQAGDGRAFISHETDLEAKEKKQILYETVNRLPGNQKVTFILSKFDNLSYREIADIMNLSLSSVESLIHRARMNLQKQLLGTFPEYSKK